MHTAMNEIDTVNLLLVSVLQQLLVQVNRLHRAVHVTLPHLDELGDDLPSVSTQVDILYHMADKINSNQLNSVEAVAAELSSVLIWITKTMRVIAGHLEMEFRRSYLMRSAVKTQSEQSTRPTTIVTLVQSSAFNSTFSVVRVSNHSEKQYKAIVLDVHNTDRPIIVLNQTIQPVLNFNHIIQPVLCRAVLDLHKHTRRLHRAAVVMLRQQLVSPQNTLFAVLLSARDTLRQSMSSMYLLVRAVIEMFPQCKADSSDSFDQSDFSLEQHRDVFVSEFTTNSPSQLTSNYITSTTAKTPLRGSTAVLNTLSSTLSMPSENDILTQRMASKFRTKSLQTIFYDVHNNSQLKSTKYPMKTTPRVKNEAELQLGTLLSTTPTVTQFISTVPRITAISPMYTTDRTTISLTSPTVHTQSQLDARILSSGEAVTRQKIADEMVKLARLMSEIGQVVYWNVIHVDVNESNATSGVQAMSGSDPATVEDVWKEYMNELMLAAKTRTERSQVIK